MEFVLSMTICLILDVCVIAGLLKELAEYSPAKYGYFKELFKF